MPELKRVLYVSEQQLLKQSHVLEQVLVVMPRDIIMVVQRGQQQ